MEAGKDVRNPFQGTGVPTANKIKYGLCAVTVTASGGSLKSKQVAGAR